MPSHLARSSPVIVCLLLACGTMGGAQALAQALDQTSVPHAKPPHKPVKHKPHHSSSTAGAKPGTHHAPLVHAKPGPPAHATNARAAGPSAAAPPPAAPIGAPEEPTKGSNTGLPLPRFVSLKSNDVNMRTGPGTRYPIEWVYHRRSLPMEVEREFEVWRLVQDQDGVKGWVHQAVLVSRRTGVVLAPPPQAGAGGKDGDAQAIRSDPQDTAAAVARLKPGVILRVLACAAGAEWCRVGIQDYRGWIRRTAIWGTLPGEAVQ